MDYDSLTKLGSIMGSGGMIVMDETTRMVDVARFFMEFCMDESCGKCIPCRAGTVQMHHLLNKILARKATARDLQKLEELCGWSATPASAASAKPPPTRAQHLALLPQRIHRLAPAEDHRPNGKAAAPAAAQPRRR